MAICQRAKRRQVEGILAWLEKERERKLDERTTAAEGTNVFYCLIGNA